LPSWRFIARKSNHEKIRRRDVVDSDTRPSLRNRSKTTARLVDFFPGKGLPARNWSGDSAIIFSFPFPLTTNAPP